MWDLGNKKSLCFIFLAFLSVLFELGLIPALWRRQGAGWSSLGWAEPFLEQAGSWRTSCCQPFLALITSPVRGCERAHAAKPLAEGKQSRRDGARPCWSNSTALALQAHGASATEQVTQAASAVAWLCLGRGEGSLRTQCQALVCWGEASQPLRESQELSARPRGRSGS